MPRARIGDCSCFWFINDFVGLKRRTSLPSKKKYRSTKRQTNAEAFNRLELTTRRKPSRRDALLSLQRTLVGEDHERKTSGIINPQYPIRKPEAEAESRQPVARRSRSRSAMECPVEISAYSMNPLNRKNRKETLSTLDPTACFDGSQK